MSTIPPCVMLPDGCIVCSEVPPTPAIPPTVNPVMVAGWGTGANSVAMLDGNLHTAFSIQVPNLGIVLGFKSGRDTTYDPTLVQYGFFFSHSGAATFAQVMEYGAAKTALAPYTSTDVFIIARVGNVVAYYQNGNLLYTSSFFSTGPLLVNACLYASGDEVI